jgi:hypothetical protein
MQFHRDSNRAPPGGNGQAAEGFICIPWDAITSCILPEAGGILLVAAGQNQAPISANHGRPE